MKKLLLTIAVAATLPSVRAAANWPQFRGPNATGVSSDAKPPSKFGLGENVVWDIDLPYSPSSPCVWEDHIFVTTFDGGKLQLRDYNRSDGENRWARAFAVPALEEFHQSEGSPAASTPATDGKCVVTYFGSFGLACTDFEGNELWVQSMPPAQTAGGFGSGTSPIIVGNTVILCRDQMANSTIQAFDIATGKKLWNTARADSPTSYTTPVVWKKNGRTDIVVAGSLYMKGYDPATGAQRWTMGGLPSFTCPTPAVTDELIFFAGWSPGKADSPWPKWESTLEQYDKNKDGKISADEYGNSAWFRSQDVDGDGFITKADSDQVMNLMAKGENVLIAVKPGGEGDLSEKNVAWKATRGLPYVPSALYYDGRVYIVKDGGMVSCYDAKTGDAKYVQERIDAGGSYYASPVAADGRVFFASQNGRVTVIKAGGDKPEIVHHADFKEKIPATMALVGENIYLRTQTKMFSFGPKPKK